MAACPRSSNATPACVEDKIDGKAARSCYKKLALKVHMSAAFCILLQVSSAEAVVDFRLRVQLHATGVAEGVMVRRK